MVDIETMGTTSKSAILSIGAVEFDLKTGELGKAFYVTIDFSSAMDAGLKVDADTVMWWLKQEYDARKHLWKDKGEHICVALEKFLAFIENCGGKKVEVWGNSARFDLGLLCDAIEVVGLEASWAYWNERCVRTLVSLNPKFKINAKFTGTPHYAPDDCKHQIKYCHETYKSLNV